MTPGSSENGSETASAPAARPHTQRIPLTHPDYRYPASRNPYSGKIQELKEQGIQVFSDNQSETHIGQWRSLYPASLAPPRPELHVEIGCNAGHVILEWATDARKAGADKRFIGIDWKFKPIFRAAEKAAKRKLDNLIMLRAHADRIKYMFGPGEIDRLYLFFPDPWPKKAQKKNRWLTANRLREVHELLADDGVFHIKTDHLEYFEWMERAVEETRDLWEIIEHTRDLHAGHPAPETLTIPQVTLFERLFIKDGIKINSFKLKKKLKSS